MSQETLRIIVDAGQLDQIITKTKRARSESAQLKKDVADARDYARTAGLNLDQLPTLNRDARLLANSLNIPGFREASALLFQARRGVLSLERSRLAKVEPDPEKAAQLSAQSLLGQAALVAFITKTVITMITKFVEDERQANIDLENMFQEGLDISFNQTRLLLDTQTGFATRWSQLQEMMQTDGFLAALKAMVIGSLPAIIQGEYGGAANYPGEPRDRWSLFKDIQTWLEDRQEESGSGDIIQGTSIPME